MKTSVIVSVIVLILIVGGGSFFGGIKYTQAKDASTRTQQMAARQGGANGGQFGQRGGAGGKGGSFINGEVLSRDDKSVTIKLQGSGSKIVLLSGSTTIGKTTDGTVTDLEVGKTVMVTGSNNTDGSVTAQSIQIRPAGAVPVPAIQGQSK